MGIVKSLTRVLGDIIFPKFCPLCDSFIDNSSFSFWCSSCWNSKIRWLNPPVCAKCGLPLSTSLASALCGRCLKEDLFFDEIRASTIYDKSLSDLIAKLKYEKRLYLLNPLAELLIKGFEKWFSREQIDLIIPVPLHVERLRERGFNQSLLLAKRLSKHIKVNLNYEALVKTRNTLPQVSLEREKRLKNLKGAFSINPNHKKVIEGKTILLIDDIITTSATIQECSKVLKKEGALMVKALSIIRTP